MQQQRFKVSFQPCIATERACEHALIRDTLARSRTNALRVDGRHVEGQDIPHGFQACDSESSILGTGGNGGSDVGAENACGAAGSKTPRGPALC